jgi:Phosphate-selective porin O and P
MVRKFQVCALGLISAFGYTTSAFAQVAADAPHTGAPAAPTAPADSKAEPNVVAEPAAPAAPPIAPEPTPVPAGPAPDAPPPTAFESLKIESKNGSANLKIGLLLQPQYEAIGSSNPAFDGASQNLFLRRTRLLVGGTLFGKLDYFFETDAPNLFKGDTVGTGGAAPVPPTGQKAGFGIGVQDAFFTYKAYDDYFKIDAGYMLTPGAHNALQGAGTLLSLDYFSNTFRHSAAFNNAGGNPAGRDAGFEFRGLVLDNHLEYRAGLFQGLRRPASATEVADRNMFRLAARVQINVFDAENAFFYAGTYLGKKKVLSVGAAYDTQSDYHHWAVDGFLDMPVGPGGLTAQVNFSKWNGGPFVALPKQTAFMAEAGYRFDAVPISPIVNFETRKISATDATEARYGLGLAYWPYAHNLNLKAFYTRVAPKPTGPAVQGYNQFNLQWQLYFY